MVNGHRPASGEKKSGDWGSIALFAILVIGAILVPSTPLSSWIVCPSQSIFDIHCPGCGMTRAVTAFVRGQWAGAFGYHAGGPVLIVGLAWVAGLNLADRLTGRKILADWRRRFHDHSTKFWGLVLTAVLVYWMVRHLFGDGIPGS